MSVLVKEVIDKLRLDIVYGEPELLEKEINTGDICRPGLERADSTIGDERVVLSD